jgi:hypothetical protein
MHEYQSKGTRAKGQNNYNFMKNIHREVASLFRPLCASSKRIHVLDEEETEEVISPLAERHCARGKITPMAPTKGKSNTNLLVMKKVENGRKW